MKDISGIDKDGGGNFDIWLYFVYILLIMFIRFVDVLYVEYDIKKVLRMSL